MHVVDRPVEAVGRARRSPGCRRAAARPSRRAAGGRRTSAPESPGRARACRRGRSRSAGSRRSSSGAAWRVAPDRVEQRRADAAPLRSRGDEERGEEPVVAASPGGPVTGHRTVLLRDEREPRSRMCPCRFGEHGERRCRRLEAVREKDAPDRVEEDRMQRLQVAVAVGRSSTTATIRQCIRPGRGG